ncbi:virion protein [Synechococcus phage S-SCSM1]|uniref:Virion protein n=1 Tax=Synechococcus phage S-SCSM1 TaxID=2588487 RepID=A0A6M2ZHN3_9CAUD|nr:virion protein [Synechococcus phage S-SCSM1]QFG06491.1 virion protein [Synechococcus phage S-SCSM1]
MGINKNFVVRNGLEVANTLLYANDETNRIGINSGTPEHTLDVIGDAAIDGALFSPVSLGGTSGVTGQYLQSTGDKWRWESFPRSRQTEIFTLTAGQTRIPATGSFGTFVLTETELTSIFLDGVKLTNGDYVINAGGGSITLFAAAFGGEELELIAHGAASVGAGNTGILGVSVRKAGIDSGTPGRVQILDFVGLGVTLDGTTGLVTAYIDSGGLTAVINDPAPTLGGYLNLNNRGIAGVGVITATQFYGGGANITGISTLNIVDYGLGLGGGAGVSGVFGELEGGSSVGIFTDTAAVGLGTTDPRFLVEIGDRQSEVAGLGTNLWVNGNARITGILTVGSSSIAIDGINDEIRIGAGFTLSADTITQTANLQITGIVTATGFDGDLVGQHKVFTAGVDNYDDYDVALFLDPTQGGHTFNRFDLGHKLQYNPANGQLSNTGVTSTRGLQVTGLSTFSDSVTFQNNIQLGNNDQAIFGAGNDLRIYFDGSNSYIQDQGGGGLNIDANPSVTIGQYGTTVEMASFRVGAGVSLFHNNSKKFETTSTGVAVTGDIVASGDGTFDGIGLGGQSPSFTGGIDATGRIRTYRDIYIVGDDNSSLVLDGRDGSYRTIRSLGDAPLTFQAFESLENSPPDGVGIGTTNPQGYGLYVQASTKFTGIVTASSFSGSGIGLTGMVDVADGTYGGSTVSPQITVADGRITGITATLISGGGGGGGGGTEVIIEDNDSIVGTAGTINFGSGLSVSSATAGVVTVTAASSEIISDTTPQLGGNLDLNNRTINGTGNININGSSRFNGPATCTSDLDVAGEATITGGLLDVQSSGVPAVISHWNSSKHLQLSTGDNGGGLNITDVNYFAINHQPYADRGTTNNLTERLRITTAGNAELSGVVTATAFYGDGSNLTGIVAGGGSGTGYFDNNQTNPGIHTTAAHVGLGTTNPRTPLQVEEIYGVYTDYGSFSATAGVTTTGDASWVIATDDFKTAEYTLHFQYNNNIQSQKVLVMNDGTTAYAQEYAIMYNNDLLVSVGASVNSGTCELQWTPEPGVTGVVTYRVVRETML